MKIGILKFDQGLTDNKKYIVPTNLIAKKSWFGKSATDLWPQDGLFKLVKDFYWGKDPAQFRWEIENREQLKYKFKSFKSDLKLTSYKDLDQWQSEIWDFTQTKPTLLPNPKILSEVFLQILIVNSLEKLNQIFFNDEKFKTRNINILFSAPAYEKDAKGGYKDSDTFKKNLREIQKNIRKGINDDRVKWPQAEESLGLMYEQYGIFYYYRFINPIVKPGRSSSLIIDIGGSTTDLALISYIENDRPFPSPPKVVSINFGGAILNRRILDKLFPSYTRTHAKNPKKIFEILEKIEDAKMSILSGKLKKVSLEDKIIDEFIIEEVFKFQWNKYVLPTLRDFLKEFILNGNKVDNLLLAGGGSLMPGIREVILEDIQVKNVLENAILIPIENERHEPTAFASLGYAAQEKILNEPESNTLTLLPRTTITLLAYPCKRNGNKYQKMESSPIVFPLELRSNMVSGENRTITFSESPDAYIFSIKGVDVGMEDIKLREVELNQFGKDQALKDVNGNYTMILNIDKFVIDEGELDQQISFTPKFLLQRNKSKPPKELNKNPGESARSISIKHAKHFNNQDITLCVDFGMTNTCVSVAMPDDFNIINSNEHIDLIEISDYSFKKESKKSIPTEIHPVAEQILIENTNNKDINLVEVEINIDSSEASRQEVISNSVEVFAIDVESKNEDNQEITNSPKNAQQELSHEISKSIIGKTIQSIIPIELPNSKITQPSEVLKSLKNSSSDYDEVLLKIVSNDLFYENSTFTILAGPPGSGKSSLVTSVAKILNEDLDNLEKCYYYKPISPVLFSIKDLYEENDSQLVRFLVNANHNPNRKFIICFDEMNLNHPEYYLSDFISCIDTKNPIHFQGQVFYISDNIKIFGTINTDLTTKPLSPKLIDRVKFLTIVPEQEKLIKRLSLIPVLDKNKQIFELFISTLKSVNLTLSYRVVNNISQFALTMESDLKEKEIVDQIFSCFLIPRLPGLNEYMNNRDEYKEALEVFGRFLKDSKLINSEIRLKNIVNGFSGQEIL